MSKKEKKTSEKEEKAIAPRKSMYPLDIFDAFDDMFDDFRRSFRESLSSWRPWRWGAVERAIPEFPFREACTDIVDSGNEFQVCAEVPGIPKDKIDITITKDSIEISAETEAVKEEKEKGFVHRERRYSRVYKKLIFPEEVLPEKANATVKDGLLEVSIPKKNPTKEPKKHKIKIK